MPPKRTIFVFFILACLAWGDAYAINFSFHNALVDAADAGQENEVRALLKARQPVDGRGDFNTTALMRAAYRGHTEIAQTLVSSGADIGIRDRGGATALHLAARAGHIAIVQLLLKYGADLEVKDNEGWTPLMRAVMNRQATVVAELVKAGANINAENEAGNTPVIQSAASGSLEVLSALMQSPDFANITLSEKEEALEVARKRKHRNLETVFSALIHPPARQLNGQAVGTAYGTPNQDSQNAWDTEAEANMPSSPMQEQQIAQGQYNVPVPDNGFEEEAQASPFPVYNQQHPLPTPHARPEMAMQQPQSTTMPADPEAAYRAFMQQQAQASAASLQQPAPTYAPPQPRYLLQLGAFANEDQAFYVWNNLKHRHPDMLNRLEPDVIKAFLAYDQTEVFRLRAKGFSQQQEAEDVCRTMRERSIECFVIEQSTGGGNMAAPPQQMVQQQAPVAPQAPAGFAPAAPQSPYGAIAQAPAYGNAPPIAPAPANMYQQPAQAPAYAQQQPYQQQSAMPPAGMQAYGAPAPYAAGAFTGQNPQAYRQQASDAPIDVMQQTQPFQQASPYYGMQGNAPIYGTPPGIVSPATNEDVREMARQQFFRSQGTQAPPTQQQYGDFYRDIQQLEQERNRYGGVSEAVRINSSPASYQQPQYGGSTTAGIWIHIGDFPSEQHAQDYYQRMFMYDSSFSHLRMVSMKESSAFSGNSSVAMRLGPAGS